MYKGKMKCTGTGFVSGIDDAELPAVLSEAELSTALMGFLETGDLGARDVIIESHVRLAMSVVARYVSHFPDKTDDLVGEALLAVTESVTLAPGRLKEPYNISGWIVSSIHNRLSGYLKTDSIVRMPEWVHKKGGSHMFIPSFVQLSNQMAEDKSMESLRSRLHEMIVVARLTDIENLIISKCLMGYKIIEVAREVGLSQQYISRMFGIAVEKLRAVRHSY